MYSSKFVKSMQQLGWIHIPYIQRCKAYFSGYSMNQLTHEILVVMRPVNSHMRLPITIYSLARAFAIDTHTEQGSTVNPV